MTSRTLPSMQRAEGFERQRLTVLPRPTVSRVAAEGPLSQLLVTDAGWFPHADNHYRERHQGAAETVLIICSEGQGWCTLGNDTFAVEPGDVLVIPAFTPHRYGAAAVDPWTIWWLHVTGRQAVGLARSLVDNGGLVAHRVDLARVLQLADEALRFMERGEAVEHLQAAAGCAWHLFGLLGLPLGAGAARPDPVARALAIMSDRIDGSVSVGELAALVNLSPSHFAAMFRKSTGTSVLHQFIAMKMTIARDMLDAGYPISTVAQRLGFRDAFYFSRQFSRHHGMNPSAYRTERRLPDRGTEP